MPLVPVSGVSVRVMKLSFVLEPLLVAVLVGLRWCTVKVRYDAGQLFLSSQRTEVGVGWLEQSYSAGGLYW